MPDGESLSPDEAFWLLGEEMRLGILRTVWEAGGPISFTAIRERMGTPDSGRFNYHIGKLRGHFLIDGEDGYQLTQAGREVIRAVMAGTVTDAPALAPTAIDADCRECGGALHMSYDGHGVIECGSCGSTVMWNEFPPAGLASRTPDDVAAAFDRWTQSRFRLAMDGICPSCAAAMTMSLLDDDPADLASHHRCPNCKYEARVPLFGHVLFHPSVIALFDDAGIDITRLPYWELQRIATAIDETVTSEEPWRAMITIDAGDQRLQLTLDASLAVIETDQSDP